MPVIVRERNIQATPEQIWNSCFAPMKWEQWDPDVESLEDVTGPCANGTTFTFVMVDDSVKRIPVTLSDVTEHKSLRFSGAAVLGLMKFEGHVQINASSSGAEDQSSLPSVQVEYSFRMYGLLGSVLSFVKPDIVVQGVEKGLENMKQIAEGTMETT